MKISRLGTSGLKVSELALGTWTFGRETDLSGAMKILDWFADSGGNFIDTADAYHEGEAESILGRWLSKRQDRDALVLATKVFFPTGSGATEVGLSRKHICNAIEGSLRRLQTEYIDLYQPHYWDPSVDLDETMSTLDDLVSVGKVRYIGVSNFLGWQVMKAVMLARANGWRKVISVQDEYSLLSRGVEWEVLPACWDAQLALIPWSPLGGGWLTGKYPRGATGPPPGTRVAESALPWELHSWEQRANEQVYGVIDAVRAVAERRDVPLSQVALNWVRAKPNVGAPIVGARTVEHLEIAVGCTEWELDSEEMTTLDEASAIRQPYPYGYVDLVGRMWGRGEAR